MNPYRKITPEGSRDLLFEECAAQNRVKELLMNLFCGRGYREVMPPTLEYCDLFTLPGAEIPLEEMYKMTDRWGRLLVLRPAGRVRGRAGRVKIQIETGEGL